MRKFTLSDIIFGGYYKSLYSDDVIIADKSIINMIIDDSFIDVDGTFRPSKMVLPVEANRQTIRELLGFVVDSSSGDKESYILVKENTKVRVVVIDEILFVEVFKCDRAIHLEYMQFIHDIQMFVKCVHKIDI